MEDEIDDLEINLEDLDEAQSDDEPIIPDPTPDPDPTPKPAVPTPTPAAEEEEDEADPQPADPDGAAGIELFLSDHGITGGMIEFDDGDPVHFADLSADEQANLFTELVQEKIDAGTADYMRTVGLTEPETNALNASRTAKIPLDEYIENLAQERASEITRSAQNQTIDYANMSDEDIHLQVLVEELGEDATDEEITEAYEEDSKARGFKRMVARERAEFVREQDADKAAIAQQQVNEQQEDLRAQTDSFVDYVTSVDQIGGIPFSYDQKNEVLEEILETNEHGDSNILQQWFSNPAELTKAVFLYKHAEEHINALGSAHARGITEAVAKGRNEVLGTNEQAPRVSVRTTRKARGKTVKAKPTSNTEPASLYPLHTEDL